MLSNADRDRGRTALRFYVQRNVWAPGGNERDGYQRLLAEFHNPVAQHTSTASMLVTKCHMKSTTSSIGAVGGAPDLQEARNLIDEIGGRLRP